MKSTPNADTLMGIAGPEQSLSKPSMYYCIIVVVNG